MTPDDPRHGTVAGHIAHQRDGGDYCLPCITAKARYDKQRVWDALNGRSYTVPSLGARRRIQALRAVGWSRERIAREAGWATSGSLRYVTRSDTMTRATHDRIAEVYERLCMQTPPDPQGAARARTWATRLGLAPPLAWDDIDDPDATPNLGGIDDDIDPVVVDRLYAGQRVTSTRAEKVEALRRWMDSGRSQRSFCQMHGWAENRYVDREEGAA